MTPDPQKPEAPEGVSLRKLRTQRCDVCRQKRNVVQIDRLIQRRSDWRLDERVRVRICSACAVHVVWLLIEERRKES